MTETIAQILADAADGQPDGAYTLSRLRNAFLGIVPVESTVAFAPTITWSLDSDPVAKLTVTGPITITAAGGLNGRKYWINVSQDSTGSRAITLAGVTVIGGLNWDLTANAVTELMIVVSNGVRYAHIGVPSTTIANSGVFNVKSYGAVGDAVTDDSGAINSAIVACNAAGGGTVLFPPASGGFYSVNSVVTLLPGVFLLGMTSPGYFDGYDGYTATVLPGSPCRIKASSTFAPFVDGSALSAVVSCSSTNDRGHGFGIRDLVLDGNARTSYTLALMAGSFYERRLYLNNVGITGSNYNSNCIGFEIQNTLFNATDCNFYGNSYGISGDPMTDSMMVNCYIHSNTVAGLNLSDGGSVTVIGGKIEENYGPGVRCHSGGTEAGVNLIGVWFQHNTYPAIYCFGTATTVWAKATGCWFGSNGYAQTLGNGAQIYADGHGRIIADDCMFGNGSATDFQKYHIGVTSGGKVWHRNSVFKEAGATANVYNDAASGSAIVTDGGLVGSLSTAAASVTLDGVVLTSLAAAYAALQSTGGKIYVPHGYTETMTADLSLTKPMVSIEFLGSATITMGSHVITTAANPYPSISGLSIRGPSRGSNDAQAAGQPTFIYTGTGKAISIGISTSDLYGIDLVNFGIDITGAGNAAKALYLNGIHEVNLSGINIQGKTSTGTTQIGIDSDGAGFSSFSSYQTFRDIFVFGTHTCVLIEGPSNNGNNANTFFGGSLCPASDGTALNIQTGDTNQAVNLDVHNAAIGVRFGANAIRNNLLALRVESNTTDVQFDSGATLNSVITNVVPVVVDNSGLNTNWAIIANSKPTAIVARDTTTASAGNIQVNLQPFGAGAAVAGVYRLSVFFEVTTVATGGTYGIQAFFTDDAKAETIQMVAAGTTLTATGCSQATTMIRSTGSANITYKVAVTGITGTPSYTAYAVLERLF